MNKQLDYRDPDWVAETLGLDKNTVYKYLQDGTLPGLQLGRKWLISERRLAEFLEDVDRRQTEQRRAYATRWTKSIRGWGRFTQRARDILSAASEEAQALKHNHIGTEHILLAITARSDCVAYRALAKLGADIATLRDQTAAAVPPDNTPLADGHLSRRARDAVNRAVAESRAMRHHYVGTEHLLLALLALGEGIAYSVLSSAGVSHSSARRAIEELLAAG